MFLYLASADASSSVASLPPLSGRRKTGSTDLLYAKACRQPTIHASKRNFFSQSSLWMSSVLPFKIFELCFLVVEISDHSHLLLNHLVQTGRKNSFCNLWRLLWSIFAKIEHALYNFTEWSPILLLQNGRRSRNLHHVIKKDRCAGTLRRRTERRFCSTCVERWGISCFVNLS